MNKIFLIGNLTRDPELSETSSGTPYSRFSLAVNRPYANADGEKQTDFFECTVWNATAEAVARYSKKGNKLSVVGTVQVRDYEDNEGTKRRAWDIVVNEVEFLTPKKQDDQEPEEPTRNTRNDSKPVSNNGAKKNGFKR